MVGYFKGYIPNLSRTYQHLHSLLGKKAPFVLSEAFDQEFCDLKSAFISPKIILNHPNWDKEFEIHTDASSKKCGAMLSQRHNDILRPVRLASRSFSVTEYH